MKNMILLGWIPLILSVVSQVLCVWAFIECSFASFHWNSYQIIGFSIAWCGAYVFSIVGWFAIFDKIFK